MRICMIDGEKLKDKEMLHDAMALAMDFPDWYGRNLDALHDCLTDVREETEIRIRNERALSEHLGSYAAAFKKVLCMAAKENERIRWEGQRNGSE